MKRNLLIPKTALAFLMALFSVWGWGQTLVNYKFENSLTQEAGSVGSPNLTASSTVSYFSGVTGQSAAFASSTGKYFELTIETTGYSDLKISFSGRSSQSNTTWIVSGDSTGGTTFSNIATLTCGNGSFTNLNATSLGSSYDNKSLVKIRITAGGTSATSRIDDLIITGVTSSNPNLSISGSASNGSLCLNTANTPVTYTITNNGTIDATGVSVSSSNSQFVLSALSSPTITAGGTATFTSTFTPTSTGTQTSTLTVSSTTSGSNSPTYSINGIGLSSVTGVVTTSAATAIAYTGVTLNGNVTTVGTCPASTEKGFVYGTSSNTYGAPIAVGSSVAAGAYSYSLGSLVSGTTYYYKAYIKDANGNYLYGAEQSFSTSAVATQIAFVNVPSNGTANSNLASFTVEARTASNTVDTGYSGTVTVTKASGSGVMSGSVTNISFTNGVATFNNVKFDTADTYTISATSGSFSTITSGNIIINVAPILIAGWDFENTTITGSGTTPTVNPSIANSGILISNSMFSGYHLSASSAWNTATGNGSAKAAAVANWAAGDYWQMKFQTVGYRNIRFTISQRGSNTGPKDFKLQYSIDGTTFTDITGASYSILNDSWTSSSIVAGSVRAFDLSSISEINNKSLVFIRIINTSTVSISNGTVGSTGTSLIDDVLVEGSVLPTTIWTNSWSNGVPNNETNVIVNGNYSTSIQPSFTSNNITIQNGAVLEITSGNTITGENIIVENGGNLIQRTGSTLTYSGTFTVNKTGASAASKYAFWASPVANQNLTTIFGATTPQFITEYNTSTNYFVNAATTSVDGKGYSIKNPVANALVSFVGTPNNDNLTYTLNTASFGYNLVGNPYPSDLNLVDFYNANSAKIGSTFYFWDSNSDPVTTQAGNTTTNVGYATYNPNTQVWAPAPNVLVNPTGNVAKVAQGFFVQATNPSDTSLGFTNAMRTSEAGSFFNKNNSSLEGKYWVKLSSSYNTNNTFVVAYLNGASNAFDAYDSKALGISSDAFYTFAGAEKLIIQGKGSFNTSDVVPVGAKHFETGNFTISLTQKEGIFNNGQAIYLHDMLLGTYTNLQNTSYNFTANAGEIADRFEIVYQLGTLSTSEAQKGGFEVYRQGDDFYVRNTKNIEKIEIFDAAGRKVQEINASSQLVKIHVDAKGFYIIKAKSAGKEYTKKITY